MKPSVISRAVVVFGAWVLFATALVTAGPAAAQSNGQQGVAQRCFGHHQFGRQPVDVAKTADGQTVLAQVGWGYHDAVGCYLSLNDEALTALRAAPPPQNLPDAATDASQLCFAHHKFGERPVDVAKSADGQTVLARLSWGHHNSIGCYLTLDDSALTTLRTAAQPEPTPDPTPEPTPVETTGSFTDSTGRRIRYRVHHKQDWNLSQPRGAVINFHGNNQGTEDDMFWGPDESVLEQGLLFVRVASPASFPDFPAEGNRSESFLFGDRIRSNGMRNWNYTTDYRLIHELLQSNLDGNVALDHNKIIFQGGSQGTSFIARFLERYATVYGGGFHAWCGDSWLLWPGPHRIQDLWSPTVPWSKYIARTVAQRMRVFVEATTGDFVHDDAVAMRDYYRDVLGLNTRWDLDAPGGHCSQGATPRHSIVEWLSETPITEVTVGTVDDHDGDGLVDALDPDDDNDGAPDVIDALPLEPRDWLDTDSDGIGDFADRDADGDGIENAADLFSLDPTEWRDNDEDGIGDNIDVDDDNDGVPDGVDPDPLRGPRNDQLTFKPVRLRSLDHRLFPFAQVHRSRPVSVKYPEALGSRQYWHSIRLGDGANPVFEVMIDSYERDDSCEDVLLAELCGPQTLGHELVLPGCSDALLSQLCQFQQPYYERWYHKIYIDRNRNRDLTDDGPPLVMARNLEDRGFHIPSVHTIVKVPYSTGELLPYGLFLYPVGGPEDIRLLYGHGSRWVGLVPVPGAEPVLVGTVDINADGVFNTGTLRYRPWSGQDTSMLQDFVCVDTDRDGFLNECSPNAELASDFQPVYADEPFTLDGRTYTLEVASTGHTVRIR